MNEGVHCLNNARHLLRSALEVRRDMEKLYSENAEIVNYYRIPVEVAQDHNLSDGAVLLFAEVFGLFAKYGNCNASDAHFMERRGKGSTTIQRQLVELETRGHLQITTKNRNERSIVVPARYLGSKDTQGMPENGESAEKGMPGNGQRKTLENQKESPKTPESSETIFAKSANEVWKSFQEKGSLIAFEQLNNQCRTRPELWNLAVLSAEMKNKVVKLDSPIAWIRKVVAQNTGLSESAVFGKIASIRETNATPEERRQDEDFARAEEDEKQANNAPPAAAVSDLLKGAVKSMPGQEKPTEKPAPAVQEKPAEKPVPVVQDDKPVNDGLSRLARAKIAARAKLEAFPKHITDTVLVLVSSHPAMGQYLKNGIGGANASALAALIIKCQEISEKMSGAAAN